MAKNQPKPPDDSAAQAEADRLISNEDDPMLTFTEAAAVVGKSAPTIHRWVAQGLLAAVRDPSGLRRIRKSELVTFYGATAMAKAAEEKQDRIDRMQRERAKDARDIAKQIAGYDRAMRHRNYSQQQHQEE